MSLLLPAPEMPMAPPASVRRRVARAIFESGQPAVRYDDLRAEERAEWLSAADAALAVVEEFYQKGVLRV